MRKLTFFGKVLPERALISISIPETSADFSGTHPSYKFRIDIIYSQITAHIALIGDEYGKFTLKNHAEADVTVFLDFAGLFLGYGYDAEITCYVDHFDDSVFVFGIDIPEIKIADPKEIGNYVASYSDQIFESNYIRMAVANFREAIRGPSDTGLFCYRAAENVMQYFKELHKVPENSHADGKAWKFLRSNLNVEEDWLRELKKFADPARYGKPISISSEERVDVLARRQSLIIRYLDFLKGGGKNLDSSLFPPLAK